jgi:hypothetical protein
MRYVESERRIELNNWLGEYVYVVTAKTNAERQRDMRQSRAEAGIKEIRNLWCHPDDEAAIREFAAKLQRKREGKRRSALTDRAREK